MTEHDCSGEYDRRMMNTVDNLSSRSNRSLAISVVFYVGIGLVAAIIAAVTIIRSFEGRGVAIAIAVVGGSVGVFLLALGARLLGGAIVKALKVAQDPPDTNAKK